MYDKLTHSEWITEIQESLAYYKAHNDYVSVEFMFANPNHYDTMLSDSMKRMFELWRKLKDESDDSVSISVDGLFDTVFGSFDLNQDFIVVQCSKCIRDYAYALPVSDDVDTLARIVEMIYDGELYCITKILNP